MNPNSAHWTLGAMPLAHKKKWVDDTIINPFLKLQVVGINIF